MAKTAQEVRDWLGYLTQDELDYLKDVAAKAKSGAKFVNIGAGGGTSGTAFMESNPDIKVWTIDPQESSDPRGCLEGERLVLEEAGLIPDARYAQICGRSQDVAKTWEHGMVDVVFIDGDHNYQAVVDDITGWLVHLKAGGLLIVHDYKKTDWWKNLNPGKEATQEKIQKVIKAWEGVDRAVDELLLPVYVKSHVVDTTIAFKKTKKRKPAPKKKTAAKKGKTNVGTSRTTSKKTGKGNS